MRARSTTPIPGPILARLIEAGVLFADGASRRARLRRCPRCGALVVHGLDDERCAGLAVCDPWPLDVYGEAATLLAGLHTYDLTREGDGLALTFRYPESIQGRPAGRTPHWDVLGEHRCGRRPLGTLAVPQGLARKRVLATLSDDPPF